MKAINLRGEYQTRRVWLNGEELLPDESLARINHSPDGFNWGYGGSGPAQLALAIVLKVTDQAIGYQEFKNLYIATRIHGDFNISLDITEWFFAWHSPIPYVILTNGVIVANYSSPHSFKFIDDSVLNACTIDRANEPLIRWEEEDLESQGTVELVRPTPYLTTMGVIDMLDIGKLFEGHGYVIVPRPVLEAYQIMLENSAGHVDETKYMNSPFVTGRLANRVHKILHIDKFCK